MLLARSSMAFGIGRSLLEGRARRAWLIPALSLVVVAPARRTSAQFTESARSGSISVRVLDDVDQGPVSAEILLSPGARTLRGDGSGLLRLEQLGAGTYTIRARALGYAVASSIVELAPGESASVSLRLRREIVTLKPVSTTARSPEREQFDEGAVPGVVSLTTNELTRLPTIGDRDILRAASLLPGVSARNDFSSGMNVRGGEADQNLVLLDGVPIYNPFHLGGLFGTFIDAAVRRVDVFTGGFPAQYGGRLSSVLDVTSLEDPRAGMHTTADASLLSSAAAVTGASGSGRFSGTVAVRRTYADQLIAAVVGSNEFPYHFRDVQAHGVASLPGGGKAAVTAYIGRDDLLTSAGTQSALVPGTSAGESSIAFDWSNQAFGLQLTQPVGERATVEQRISLSGFATHFGIATDSLALAQTLRDLRVAGRFQLTAEAHRLAAGYDVSRYRTLYREHLSVAPGGLFAGDEAHEGQSQVRQVTSAAGLFVEDSWRPVARLQLRAGFRAEHVAEARWSGFSPRLSARLFLRDDLALSVAAGRYTQWMRAIRNEDLPIRVFDLWVASDSIVPVSSAEHLVVGAERWFGASRFVRVEAYGKRFDRLLEQASTIDPRIRPELLREFSGHSYGLDLYARQLERGGIGGWLSYSYGLSSREFGGVRYFPAHDRRHNANIAVSWTPGKRYTLGAHVGVASGTPYTAWAGYLHRWQYDPMTSRWSPGASSNGEENLVRGVRNGDRLPLYSRVDVSAERLFRVGRAIVRPHLSVVNVLNHENVLLYALDASRDPPGVRRYGQFPILPSIGVRAEF